MDIKKSIRLALAHADLKANELALRMGVTDAYVSQAVNGKKIPNIQSIQQMAQITGFKVSEFIALGES